MWTRMLVATFDFSPASRMREFASRIRWSPLPTCIMSGVAAGCESVPGCANLHGVNGLDPLGASVLRRAGSGVSGERHGARPPSGLAAVLALHGRAASVELANCTSCLVVTWPPISAV